MSQLSLSSCQDICFPSGIIEFRDICGACHINSYVLRRLSFAIGTEEKPFPQKPWVRSRGSTPYQSHLGNLGMKKPCDKLTNDLDRQDWFLRLFIDFSVDQLFIELQIPVDSKYSDTAIK